MGFLWLGGSLISHRSHQQEYVQFPHHFTQILNMFTGTVIHENLEIGRKYRSSRELTCTRAGTGNLSARLLSYYYLQIESMTHLPLFRFRSWNNGVRCESFYIPTNQRHFSICIIEKIKSFRQSHKYINSSCYDNVLCLINEVNTSGWEYLTFTKLGPQDNYSSCWTNKGSVLPNSSFWCLLWPQDVGVLLKLV